MNRRRFLRLAVAGRGLAARHDRPLRPQLAVVRRTAAAVADPIVESELACQQNGQTEIWTP